MDAGGGGNSRQPAEAQRVQPARVEQPVEAPLEADELLPAVQILLRKEREHERARVEALRKCGLVGMERA
eukprot:2977735-Prymnesium_polylepis.1